MIIPLSTPENGILIFLKTVVVRPGKYGHLVAADYFGRYCAGSIGIGVLFAVPDTAD